MKTIHLKLQSCEYDIIVGKGVLKELGSLSRGLGLGDQAVVVTSPAISRLHGKALLNSLFSKQIIAKVLLVPDGEKSKSASEAMRLVEKIARHDVQRNIFLIAFGGGVVGDLTGFIASIYKRGIPYIQIPTTLLAQVDSAIGGKVAIDLPQGKNLVGSYYHPRLVLSDIALLETLKLRQIRNGLAEVIKYGIIQDRQLFEYIEKHYSALLDLETDFITEVVTTCSRIKSDIVMQDEKEKEGIRTILNYGHTVGHAIESASRYDQYQHGEAISVGMQTAADISMALGYLEKNQAQRIDQLLNAVGLPGDIQGVKLSAILKTMQHDKKFLRGKNRFVLAEEIGRVRIVEGIPSEVIKKAIQERMA